MRYSLITCTFNAEKYIDSYFDVIKKIEYDDFEVVIIDDCSTDFTYEKICEIKNESNIRIITYKQEVNMGPGIARNKGIKLSSGERIVFLDVDDKVASGIFNVLDLYTGDCIFFDYYKWFIDGRLEKHSSLNGKKVCLTNIDDVMRRTTGAVWGKVFLREIINNNGLEFPKLYKTEDLVFLIAYLVNCNTVVQCGKPLYYYRISTTSAMNTNIDNQIVNAEEAMKILKTVLANHVETYDIIFSKEITYDLTNIYIRLGKNKNELKEFWRDKNTNICTGRNRNYYSLIQKIIFRLIGVNAYKMLVLVNRLRR